MKRQFWRWVLFVAALLQGFPVDAASLDLHLTLRQAEPGMWVRMKNPNGLETVTLVTQKDDKTLTVEQHTYRKKKPQSWMEQVIRIEDKKVLRSRIKYPGGEVDDIPVENWELIVESFENYQEVGVEEVSVPAGKFSCRHYRTVVDDHLVHVWLSDQVPLTHLVKSTFQGGSVLLLEHGKGGVQPAFQ